MSVLVIAEIGSTHDGSFDKALSLVRAAKEAGADVVKGQFWSSADRLADRRKVPDYYRDIYRRYQVSVDWLRILKAECDFIGIEWACTTYLPEDVATVAPFVKFFKISSFEAESVDLFMAHCPFLTDGRTVLVSLGMDANPNAVPNALRHSPCYSTWWRRARFMHCVSAYPATASEMGLAILRDEEWRDSLAGLSDHSRHPWMGALAVAAGAEIIEAHLRLDDTDPENPDYATAFNPTEFAEYVRNIRLAEQVMGSGEKRLQECEREMAQYRVQS